MNRSRDGSIALSSGIRMKKLAIIIIGLISEALKRYFLRVCRVVEVQSGRLEVLTYLMIVDIDGKEGVKM